MKYVFILLHVLVQQQIQPRMVEKLKEIIYVNRNEKNDGRALFIVFSEAIIINSCVYTGSINDDNANNNNGGFIRSLDDCTFINCYLNNIEESFVSSFSNTSETKTTSFPTEFISGSFG